MKSVSLTCLLGTLAALALPATAAVTVTLSGPDRDLAAGELFIFRASVAGATGTAKCTWAIVEDRRLESRGQFDAPRKDVKLTFMDGKGNILPAGTDGHETVYFSTGESGASAYRSFQIRATSEEDPDAFACVSFRVKAGSRETKAESRPAATGQDSKAQGPYVWETPFTSFLQAGKYYHRAFDTTASAPTLVAVQADKGKPARLVWLPFAGKQPVASITLPEGASPQSNVVAMADGSAVVGLYDPIRLCRVSPTGKLALIGKDGAPWTPGKAKEKKEDKAEAWRAPESAHLAADVDGNVLVAAAGRIFRVAPDGTSTILAGGGQDGQDLSKPVRPALGMNLAEIDGLTVARDGRILFLVPNRGVYALFPDGVARLVWENPALVCDLLETSDGRLLAWNGRDLCQADGNGETQLLCRGTNRKRSEFSEPIPALPLTPSSGKQVGLLNFPIALPGGGVLLSEQWTHRVLYLGPPGGDDLLLERVNAVTAALENQDYALAARIRESLRLEAGVDTDPQVLKRVNKAAHLSRKAGLEQLPAVLVKRIMASFEHPKGDRVRARIASYVLEQQIQALPEGTRKGFEAYLAGQTQDAAAGENKGESKAS